MPNEWWCRQETPSHCDATGYTLAGHWWMWTEEYQWLGDLWHTASVNKLWGCEIVTPSWNQWGRWKGEHCQHESWSFLAWCRNGCSVVVMHGLLVHLWVLCGVWIDYYMDMGSFQMWVAIPGTLWPSPCLYVYLWWRTSNTIDWAVYWYSKPEYTYVG